MKQELRPTLDDLRLECVLMQAWKKTTAYLRSHSWYADILEIDYQSLRIPRFISELQESIDAFEHWTPQPLHIVPAPKTQQWQFNDNKWEPKPGNQKRLRPLAHVSLRDQVVATAIMLCLADRVESQMGDPRLSINSKEDDRRVLAYGHRLFCDRHNNELRHRWGSTRLYRQYFQDYRTFLKRPEDLATSIAVDNPKCEVAIVQSDLSKFYDRVQPELLRTKVRQFQHPEDDPRFYTLVDKLFDWRWSDRTRAERHAKEQQLDGFTEVALPQGLVASGFFANVFLQDFEHELRSSIGGLVNEELGLSLKDAVYYVDDLRLVLSFPRSIPALSEEGIKKSVSDWLQSQLNKTARGMLIEASKTTVTVIGRDQRFLVPQSRAAQRIQSAVSGTFDMLHGTELIGAIEGFFHTQQRYSTSATGDEGGRTGLLVGKSDMRDDTAARFAAGRFRRTFRSLRPMLQDSSFTESNAPSESWVDPAQEDALIDRELVLTKEQLDDRAKVFAALLIEEWTADPANVRLLRVALDMYPDRSFLDEVLRILKPGWTAGGSKRARREIRLYCLAELFRAGATETGMVADNECLPAGVSVNEYHERLLEEALDIFDKFLHGSSSSARFPWYLMQQIFLYLAAQNAFPDNCTVIGGKGGPLLSLYRGFAKFLSGERIASSEERCGFLAIARSGFSHEVIVKQFANKGVSPQFLSRLGECSPSTATALWKVLRNTAGESLKQTAARLGLEPRKTGVHPKFLPDLAASPLNPFFFELNLLRLASWLFGLSYKDFEKGLTPWQIECSLKSKRADDHFQEVDQAAFRVSTHVNTGAHLFVVPEWCVSQDERKRYQIGALLRFAIRGNTDLYAGVSRPRSSSTPRYARSTSHWQQQRYSGFQGRTAFGPEWLPLSSFVEDLLYELLKWPGSGGDMTSRSVTLIATTVSERLKELERQIGAHSRALFLRQTAPAPYKTEQAKPWRRQLRIGVISTITPNLDDYQKYDTDAELLRDSNFRQAHRSHLAAALEGVSQMCRVRETHYNKSSQDGQKIDLLVFPELAIHPSDVKPLLEPFARKYRCMLLFGMVYHREVRLQPPSLINSCQWLVPERSRRGGFQLRPVEQGKKHLTSDEKALSPTPVGFRPAQWLIDYEWSSEKRPLTLSASVCYDATDLALAADLRSRSDLYIICALNRDVGTFDRMSEALHYHMYQGVLIVNNGQFGGSSFFMPFEKQFNRQVFHLHGQPQVSIAFAEIDPEKLITRPRDQSKQSASSQTEPKGNWKTPPAGWQTRSTKK